MNRQHCLALAAILGVASANSASAQDANSVSAQNIGPSTTTEPYLVPTVAGVSVTSVLTVGDSVGGYRMVGIPDGLGAWLPDSNVFGRWFGHKARSFNLVMSHELGRGLGTPRAHGSKGAFVSQWTIDRVTLKVISGRDHMTSPNDILTWNGSGYSAGATALERLCSADLADPKAYGLRTPSRIFLSGEETSPPFAADHGRVFAHILDGPERDKSFELPRLGKMSFENALANPFPDRKTIVMLNDDAGRETNVTAETNVCRTAGQSGCKEPPSELYMYVGSQQPHGAQIEQAGLTNGNFYGVRVVRDGQVVTGENKDFVFASAAPAVTSARFEVVNFGDVSNKMGVQIQDAAIANKVTQFIRIEDGAWDPRPGRQRDYYFITTGRITSDATTWRPSRLWRLRFDNIARPEAGGSIEMLLTNQFYPGAATTPDADPGYQMFDNMTIDGFGRIVLQEDVGGNDRLGRIYVYGIDSGQLVQVARHNPKFFGGNASNNPTFLTNDEESSGVVDAAELIRGGWFLTTVQPHHASSDAELVENGQILALFIDPSIARGRGGDAPLPAALKP
ncbi:phytase [Methylocystis sp. H4A]|uniref:phytase n=1 Tax=Methylocystis sp. H4A TaxID=2785788 RepID=UPI0018C2363D|nr:phytase [Methylocystis sp. H4A]MBG0800749.1 phytase [Methylocystis sp. H4A]